MWLFARDSLNDEHDPCRKALRDAWQSSTPSGRAASAAALLHGPDVPSRKATEGRYRQFNQSGVKNLRFSRSGYRRRTDPDGRAPVGRSGARGHPPRNQFARQPEERAKYRAGLVAYAEKYTDLLDEDAKRRLHTNRCASSTARIRRCRKSSSAHPG